jgi:hypothetical protein
MLCRALSIGLARLCPNSPDRPEAIGRNSISTFLLREGFGVWRFVSAGLITLGLMLTRSQR